VNNHYIYFFGDPRVFPKDRVLWIALEATGVDTHLLILKLENRRADFDFYQQFDFKLSPD
jgi:hypothetical protein